MSYRSSVDSMRLNLWQSERVYWLRAGKWWERYVDGVLTHVFVVGRVNQ